MMAVQGKAGEWVAEWWAVCGLGWGRGAGAAAREVAGGARVAEAVAWTAREGVAALVGMAQGAADLQAVRVWARPVRAEGLSGRWLAWGMGQVRGAAGAFAGQLAMARARAAAWLKAQTLAAETEAAAAAMVAAGPAAELQSAPGLGLAQMAAAAEHAAPAGGLALGSVAPGAEAAAGRAVHR